MMPKHILWQTYRRVRSSSSHPESSPFRSVTKCRSDQAIFFLD